MAELSAGYVISQSFRTYFKHFGLIAKYALSLTGLLALYFIASITFLGSEFLNTADETVAPPIAITILMLVLRIVLALGSVVLIIALMRELYKTYTGRSRDTMMNELHTARTLLWPYIYTSILLVLLQLIPMLLMVFSFFYAMTNALKNGLTFFMLGYLTSACIMIWIGVRYSMVTPALTIDGIRGPAALKASAALIHGRWWRVFWWTMSYTITISLIVAAIALFFLTPVGFFAGVNFQGSWLLSNLVVFVLSSFFLPLGLIPLVVIYENLKTSPTVAK